MDKENFTKWLRFEIKNKGGGVGKPSKQPLIVEEFLKLHEDKLLKDKLTDFQSAHGLVIESLEKRGAKKPNENKGYAEQTVRKAHKEFLKQIS